MALFFERCFVYFPTLAPQSKGPGEQWPVNCESVVDLDGPGPLDREILITAGPGFVRVGSQEIGKVYCITKEGRKRWEYTIGYPYGLSSLAAADLDGDGILEIVVVGDGGIYCLNKDGECIWEFGGSGDAKIAIADLNKVGNLEIIATIGNNLHCINKDGENLWECQINPIGSPTVADLDGDGPLGLEILVPCRWNLLRCIDKNGQIKWEYCPSYFGFINLSPAVGDLDGDGSLEILTLLINLEEVSSPNTKLICLDKDGIKKWEYTVGYGGAEGGPNSSSPTVADLDGDGYSEVLIVGVPGEVELFCIDRNGTKVWRFDQKL